MSNLHIIFRRSGGFAGLNLSAELETATRHLVYGASAIERQLSEGEARTLEHLVAGAGISPLNKSTPSVPAPDQFQNQITVIASGERQVLHFADDGIPEAVAPLLQALTRLARGQTLE